MSGGRRSCNGVLLTGEVITDGLITYRRKKRARVADIESVKGSPDGANEHGVFSGVANHWRSTMVHMLHLPEVGEGDGIQSCIHDALQSCLHNFPSKTKSVEVSITQSEDRYKGTCEIVYPPEVKAVFPDSAPDGLNVKLQSQTDINEYTAKFQKILLEIFCSENFTSLCDLVCESFQNKTVSKLLDFSLINSKLRDGVYKERPFSFHEDIQRLWSTLQKVCQEILLLSTNLSKLSSISYGKQIGEDPGLEAGEEKFEGNPEGAAEIKNSMDSNVTGQFPSSDSDRSNKLDQSEASCLCKAYVCKQCGIEASGEHRLICDGCEAVYHFSCVDPFSPDLPSRSWYCASCHKDKSKSPEKDLLKRPISNRPELYVGEKNIPECNCSNKPYQSEVSCRYKVFTCKHCRNEAVGEHSLICDGCEAIYHFSCVDPPVEGIPPRNWYCTSCSNGRTEAPEPVIESEQDGLHQNCSVCDRLEFSKVDKGTRESSVSSMESGGPPEPSRTAVAHLCKLCGTCEDEDRRFLTCSNNYCSYKYYHIRCLRNNQIASQHQQNWNCWYCPSCLCRACYLDQDDADIVLCDGCDDAYHTYCMKPPRTSVPKGQWYCIQCNIARAKEGMRKHEQRILQQHGKKNVFHSSENNRPMGVLVNDVEKASCTTDLRA